MKKKIGTHDWLQKRIEYRLEQEKKRGEKGQGVYKDDGPRSCYILDGGKAKLTEEKDPCIFLPDKKKMGGIAAGAKEERGHRRQWSEAEGVQLLDSFWRRQE